MRALLLVILFFSINTYSKEKLSKQLLKTCKCEYKTISNIKTKKSGKILLAGLSCSCDFFDIENETVACRYKNADKVPSVEECLADNSLEFIYPNIKTKKFKDRIEAPSENKSGGGSGAATVE